MLQCIFLRLDVALAHQEGQHCYCQRRIDPVTEISLTQALTM